MCERNADPAFCLPQVSLWPSALRALCLPVVLGRGLFPAESGLICCFGAETVGVGKGTPLS